MGAVEILIVFEKLDIMRHVLKHPNSNEEKILYLNPEQEKDITNLYTEGGIELELIEKIELVEWFTEKYKEFGTTLEFITDKGHQEGTQFIRGFGGLGGILRYKVDFVESDSD